MGVTAQELVGDADFSPDLLKQSLFFKEGALGRQQSPLRETQQFSKATPLIRNQAQIFLKPVSLNALLLIIWV